MTPEFEQRWRWWTEESSNGNLIYAAACRNCPVRVSALEKKTLENLVHDCRAPAA
jgi:hypothetical protein